MTEVTAQIPSGFYYVLGFLIFTNLGMIFSGLYFGGRIVWYFSKLDSRTEKVEKDNNAQHEKIRGIEKEQGEMRTRISVIESHQ